MTLTKSDLLQFTGTEQWFRHPLMRKIAYTEGVQYVAEQAGAYWLIDKIATNQLESVIRKEEFQVWKLVVNDKKAAVLTCEDGNDNIVHTEEISWTDFPLDEITFWFENNVILLPSEH